MLKQRLIQTELVVSRQKIKMWKSNDDRQQLSSDGKCSHGRWHSVWSVEITQVSLVIKKKKNIKNRQTINKESMSLKRLYIGQMYLLILTMVAGTGGGVCGTSSSAVS